MGLIPTSVRHDIDAALSARGVRQDSVTGSVFLERQLNHLIPQVLNEKQPRLNAFLYLPTRTDVPAWAKTYSQQMMTSHGVAKLISNYADDLPNVGVSSVEESFNIRSVGDAIVYSIDDIAAAMGAGVPLSGALFMAARRAAEEKQNAIAWYGDAANGLYGALNHPNIPRVALSSAIASGTSADTILAMLHGLVHGVRERTKQTGFPDRMLLPTTAFDYIASTYRSSTSDTTILQAFLTQQQYVREVFPCGELDGAGDNGEDVILVFPANENSLGHVVPQMFSPQPAQMRNLAFVINCIAKTGGVASAYPLECAIGVLPAA